MADAAATPFEATPSQKLEGFPRGRVSPEMMW